MKKNIIKLCCILLAVFGVGCTSLPTPVPTPTPALSPMPTEGNSDGYALTKEAFDKLKPHLMQMVYMLFEWKYDPNRVGEDLGYDSLKNLTLDFVQSYAFEVCYDLVAADDNLYESGELRYLDDNDWEDYVCFIPTYIVRSILVSTFGEDALNRLNANEDSFLRNYSIEDGQYVYPTTDRGAIACEFIRPEFPVSLEGIIKIDANMFMGDEEELYTICIGLQPDEKSEFGYIITSFLLTEK